MEGCYRYCEHGIMFVYSLLIIIKEFDIILLKSKKKVLETAYTHMTLEIESFQQELGIYLNILIKCLFLQNELDRLHVFFIFLK